MSTREPACFLIFVPPLIPQPLTLFFSFLSEVHFDPWGPRAQSQHWSHRPVRRIPKPNLRCPQQRLNRLPPARLPGPACFCSWQQGRWERSAPAVCARRADRAQPQSLRPDPLGWKAAQRAGGGPQSLQVQHKEKDPRSPAHSADDHHAGRTTENRTTLSLLFYSLLFTSCLRLHRVAAVEPFVKWDWVTMWSRPLCRRARCPSTSFYGAGSTTTASTLPRSTWIRPSSWAWCSRRRSTRCFPSCCSSGAWGFVLNFIR